MSGPDEVEEWLAVWQQTWARIPGAERRGSASHPATLTVLTALGIGFPAGALAGNLLGPEMRFPLAAAGFLIVLAAGIGLTIWGLRARKAGKGRVLPPRLFADAVFWIPVAVLATFLGAAGAEASLDLGEEAIEGALKGGGLGLAIGGLIGAVLHTACRRASLRVVRKALVSHFNFPAPFKNFADANGLTADHRTRLVAGAARMVGTRHARGRTWPAIGGDFLDTLSAEFSALADILKEFADADKLLEAETEEDDHALEQALFDECQRILRPELDEIRMSLGGRMEIGLDLVAEARTDAAGSSRQALTAAIRKLAGTRKAELREFIGAVDAGRRRALERQFLESVAEDMAALPMRDDEKQDMAIKVVMGAFALTKVKPGLTMERAVTIQGETERAQLKKMRAPVDKLKRELDAEHEAMRQGFEKQFLILTATELDALYMPDKERRELARDVVEAGFKRLRQNPTLTPRQAFEQQLEVEKKALREVHKEVEVLMEESPPTPERPPLSEQERLKNRMESTSFLVDAGKLERIGDVDGASKLIDRARQTSEGIHDTPGLARAALERARFESRRGRVQAALASYDTALEFYRAMGHQGNVESVEQERIALTKKK